MKSKCFLLTIFRFKIASYYLFLEMKILGIDKILEQIKVIISCLKNDVFLKHVKMNHGLGIEIH